MSLRNIAIIYGILFVLLGIFGFIPAVSPHHKVLGVLAVSPLLSSLYILTGIFAFAVANNNYYTRLYFRVVGIVYGVLVLLGLVLMGRHFNAGVTIFHLLVAIISLYLGFIKKTRWWRF